MEGICESAEASVPPGVDARLQAARAAGPVGPLGCRERAGSPRTRVDAVDPVPQHAHRMQQEQRRAGKLHGELARRP